MLVAAVPLLSVTDTLPSAPEMLTFVVDAAKPPPSPPPAAPAPRQVRRPVRPQPMPASKPAPLVAQQPAPVELPGEIRPDIDNAIARHVEGTVILEATVDKRGHVAEVEVLRSHPLLATAAVDAVKQWQYHPLMLNGSPQPFVLTVTVSFDLG